MSVFEPLAMANASDHAVSAGLHHVTAIASDAPRNLAFYRDVLGFHLVKRTVNFDDPGTWHLYFADRMGTPGTIVTFFPWAGAARGRVAAGQASEIVIHLGPEAQAAARKRMMGAPTRHEERFGQPHVVFPDLDGLGLALIETDQHANPNEIGIEAVTLMSAAPKATADVLTGILGMRFLGADGHRQRFASQGVGPGRVVDLVPAEATDGRMGAGSIHHIAFRAKDDEAQAAFAKALMDHGIPVSEQKDRCYFRSIYFREPGGIIFEIATDAPGFAVDEEPVHLGENLKLPPWLEIHRDKIERALPSLT